MNDTLAACDRAYERGYFDAWDGKDFRPGPGVSGLERVCYRAGYADGSEDALPEPSDYGDDDDYEEWRAARSRAWLQSFRPPSGA